MSDKWQLTLYKLRTNIDRIYKRVSGNWVEQPSSNLNILFDTNMEYRIAKPNPVAILYSDGTFIFQDSDVVDVNHGDVIGTYTGWDVDKYGSWLDVPWFNYRDNINNIIINTIASPKLTRWWFDDCSSLTSLDLNNFDTSNVTNINAMFSGCSSLTSLDLSSFDTSNVTDMSYMFYDCSKLTTLDLSSFDMTNVTNTKSMFLGCTNLQTIYVKDETAKTKIEASTGFPTTATVIIGKPN